MYCKAANQSTKVSEKLLQVRCTLADKLHRNKSLMKNY